MIEERLPPHDLQAEESVIGSLLIDPDAIFKVSLSPDEFFDDTNKTIYRACLNLSQKNEPIDQITVAHELMRMNKLDDIGGAAYLSHLISVTPAPFYVEHHAQLVSRTAIMRQLIINAGRVAALAYKDGDVEETLKEAEDLIFSVRTKKTASAVTIKDALYDYFNKPPAGRIPTGFTSLDKILGGLYQTDLIVIAARPSQGKTSLALNIARNALELNKKVAFFSLEMSVETLVHRFLARETELNSELIRAREFTEAQDLTVTDATGVLAELPLFIDDTFQLRITDLKGKARRLVREKGIDLIILDYLQLMGDEGKENRNQEISHITKSLKILAKELNVPILALSQLSRDIEKRLIKEPQLSDLRDSGSIEQDADVVMFLQKQTNTEKPLALGEDVDVFIKKHRNGALGTITLCFLPQYSKFEEK